jgi:hypothetical protein
MSPYQVLGVPPDATEEQIKTAYRKLVKEYHPDRNKSEAAKVIIVRVNEAYEILSDPERKARYGRETYQPDLRTAEEREYEAKKAEYYRKRREREKREYEEMLVRDVRKFKYMRALAFPLLFVSLVLITDQLLPGKYYTETAEIGWQERTSGGRYRQGVLISYMRTPHFVIQVPSSVHVDYDYYGKPGKIEIEASPLLKIQKTIVVEAYHYSSTFEAPSIYSLMLPLHYLLFFSCVLTILRKEYTMMNCVFTFLPPLFGAFTIFFVLLYR